MYLDKFPSFLDDDFEIKILKKTCFHPLCLNYISNFNDNYCNIHR